MTHLAYTHLYCFVRAWGRRIRGRRDARTSDTQQAFICLGESSLSWPQQQWNWRPSQNFSPSCLKVEWQPASWRGTSQWVHGLLLHPDPYLSALFCSAEEAQRRSLPLLGEPAQVSRLDVQLSKSVDGTDSAASSEKSKTEEVTNGSEEVFLWRLSAPPPPHIWLLWSPLLNPLWATEEQCITNSIFFILGKLAYVYRWKYCCYCIHKSIYTYIYI